MNNEILQKSDWVKSSDWLLSFVLLGLIVWGVM